MSFGGESGRRPAAVTTNPMNQCVALVDWNRSGHHPTFFNHLVLALEELGIDVLALCPDPEAAASMAALTRCAASPSPRGHTEFDSIEVPSERLRSLRPRRIGAIDWTIRHFRGIENRVIAWERRNGRKADLIFHACIYDRDFQWIHYAAPLLRLPWSGLYLHALSYRMPGHPHPVTRSIPRPRQMFSHRLCRGVAVLDEGIVDAMSRDIGKPVIAFPDPADERIEADAEERVLGDELTTFADGRPVVGLFGHLQKSKGLQAFLEAARMPAAAGVCFAMAGEMLWPPDPDEKQRWIELMHGVPNLWLHLERIPTEPALAHLMAACDALAACYVDFPHSSGIQAKAAILQKPLIVSDGFLMAERVRRFRMGAVVPQNQPTQLLDAILDITSDAAAWIGRSRPLWQEYVSEHCHQRLRQQLGKLIGLC